MARADRPCLQKLLRRTTPVDSSPMVVTLNLVSGNAKADVVERRDASVGTGPERLRDVQTVLEIPFSCEFARRLPHLDWRLGCSSAAKLDVVGNRAPCRRGPHAVQNEVHLVARVRKAGGGGAL